MLFIIFPLLLSCTIAGVLAFDMSRNDNLAVYYGQNSAGNQQDLSYYCEDDTIDTIPLAFLYIFFGTGNEPEIDLEYQCNTWGDFPIFPGTNLANCSSMASDIEYCQSKGKAVTLSLGGGTGQDGFSSDQEAQGFADQIWNQFLGGSSTIRPFGKAVLDGVDLDIENGTPDHYAAFVKRIQSHASGASKKYYVTAAPQCPYPDQYIGAALNEAPFDAVYVQFYNNYCGLDQLSEYNFGTWDNWAKTVSPNPKVKVYIGAAASSNAAGEGYVNISSLISIAEQTREQYSSFGGVMLWDASEEDSNNKYGQQIKQALVNSS